MLGQCDNTKLKSYTPKVCHLECNRAGTVTVGLLALWSLVESLRGSIFRCLTFSRVRISLRSRRCYQTSLVDLHRQNRSQVVLPED